MVLISKMRGLVVNDRIAKDTAQLTLVFVEGSLI